MKAMIIRPAALGDTLMLMPGIAQLRTSTEVVLVARSPGLHFLKPHVDLCIDYEVSGWHRLFLQRLDKAFALPVPPVDKVVAFLGDPEGNVQHNLKTELPNATVHLFPPFPPEKANVHVALYLAERLQESGLPIEPETALEEASRRPLLEGEGQKIRKEKMVFHPGSGGKGKNHPPDFWLALIRALNTQLFSPPFYQRGQGGFSRKKENFIILLGPAEEQLRPFFTTNLPIEGVEVRFAPEKQELTSLLRQAPLYVGHDSGITHLAAMLGTPTIALFKDSPLVQWRPLGPAVRVIEKQRGEESVLRNVFAAAKEMIGINRGCS